MAEGHEAPRFGVFEDVPGDEWEGQPDDDPGDVIPPVAVDVEILHPLAPHAG